MATRPKSLRRLMLLVGAVAAVVVLGAVSLIVLRHDPKEDRGRANAGTRLSTKPPPPLVLQPVGLVVTPSVLDPDGGTPMSIAVYNRLKRKVSSGPIASRCTSSPASSSSPTARNLVAHGRRSSTCPNRLSGAPSSSPV